LDGMGLSHTPCSESLDPDMTPKPASASFTAVRAAALLAEAVLTTPSWCGGRVMPTAADKAAELEAFDLLRSSPKVWSLERARSLGLIVSLSGMTSKVVF